LPRDHASPSFLIGADPLRVGAVSGLGEADRMRRPQGGLDTAAGSGTMSARKTAACGISLQADRAC
jgi:hypothetical protein